MIKVGIVGCGGIANGKELPALSHRRDVEIVAYCDLIEERAKKANEAYSKGTAKVLTDYRELLAIRDIEAVYVLTPNRTHCEISVAALEAGKHVFCEKPMATGYEEAKRMLAARDRAGKLLTIGYQNRFREDSLYLKRECEAGTFGEVYFAKARALRRRAVPTWGVFLDREQQGGGPLIDIGTHALDLTLFMMDNYEPDYCVGRTYDKLAKQPTGAGTANAWGDWDPDCYSVEDAAFGFVVMKNGATVEIESSWALNIADVGEAQTLIAGTKAGADMFDGLRVNYVKNGRMCIERPEFSAGGAAFFDGKAAEAADLECECFLRAVSGQGELYVKPEQAAVVTRILEGIYRSAQSGKPYFFEEE